MAITDNEERTPNGNAHPFNMLDALAELKEAGFEQEKAEAVVRMQYRIVESNLASKWDLALVRKDIESVRKDIESVRGETKKVEEKITKVEEKITKLETRVEKLPTKDEMGYLSTVKMGSLGWIFGPSHRFCKMGLLSIK